MYCVPIPDEQDCDSGSFKVSIFMERHEPKLAFGMATGMSSWAFAQ